MKKKTQTWYELAKNDLDFAGSLLGQKSRRYYCVHFCHQAIEKMLKALVQEYTDELPLRTHNLINLANQTGLDITEDKKEFLLRLNPHYISTKYPEDIDRLYQTYSEEFVKDNFSETKENFEWLQEKLISKK